MTLGYVPHWRFLRVENDISHSASCVIRDIQVSYNVARHHNLHLCRELDGPGQVLSFPSPIACAALDKGITLAQTQRTVPDGIDVGQSQAMYEHISRLHLKRGPPADKHVSMNADGLGVEHNDTFKEDKYIEMVSSFILNAWTLLSLLLPYVNTVDAL